MKIILDTNVYIEATLSQEKWRLFEKNIIPFLPFVYLCSVVALELSLSQKKERTYFLLARHIDSMKKVERLVSPIFDDWIIASRFLKHTKESSKLCDVLIGCCARRIGAIIFTFDTKDFFPLSQKIGFSIKSPW